MKNLMSEAEPASQGVSVRTPSADRSHLKKTEHTSQKNEVHSIIQTARSYLGGVAGATANKYQARVLSVFRALGHETTELHLSDYGLVVSDSYLNIRDPCHLCSPTLVEDLLKLKKQKQWSDGTWRLTKNAFIYLLNSEMVASDEDSYDCYLDKIQELCCIDMQKLPRNQGKKSKHSTQKHITKTEIRRILSALESARNGSVWPRRTAYFLMSGLATGLRPVEWQEAQWSDESKKSLYVKTAKLKRIDLGNHPADSEVNSDSQHTNGIGGSQLDPSNEVPKHSMGAFNNIARYRFVPVASDDRVWIEAHFRCLDAHLTSGRTFKEYYDGCRLALYRAGKQALGQERSVSLYTARHQFAANCKVQKSAQETATLMGNSRRALSEYSGARVAHPSERGRARGQGDMSESQRAAIEHPHLFGSEVGQTGHRSDRRSDSD